MRRRKRTALASAGNWRRFPTRHSSISWYRFGPILVRLRRPRDGEPLEVHRQRLVVLVRPPLCHVLCLCANQMSVCSANRLVPTWTATTLTVQIRRNTSVTTIRCPRPSTLRRCLSAWDFALRSVFLCGYQSPGRCTFAARTVVDEAVLCAFYVLWSSLRERSVVPRVGSC